MSLCPPTVSLVIRLNKHFDSSLFSRMLFNVFSVVSEAYSHPNPSHHPSRRWESGSQSASASDSRFWKTCRPWLFIFFFIPPASCVYVNHWAAELIPTIVALFLSFLSSRSSSSSSFAPHDLLLSLRCCWSVKRRIPVFRTRHSCSSWFQILDAELQEEQKRKSRRKGCLGVSHSLHHCVNARPS